jgi:hypothetical protein
MALKNYKWRGYTWQFAEGEQPADAVPVDEKAAKPASDKAAKAPANKARRAPAKKAE